MAWPIGPPVLSKACTRIERQAIRPRSLAIRRMTSRQFRIGGLILATAFAALGIGALAEANYGTGAFWLVISVGWLLLAFFRDKFVAALERQRARIRS
jgi:hypothetical protein